MATYNGHNEDSSGNILLAIGNGMTATLETGTTASQAYTKGALLYYNNRLCKATKAIAKSATLTIGTNIAYTTIGEELTAHLRASNGDELYFDYKDSKPGYYPSASKTASQFVPFGGSGFTPVVISIGDTLTEYYMYAIDAGTEFQLPNNGRHVYCVTGDTNASVTIASFSTSTSITTTVSGVKLGSNKTTIVSTTPSTFPRTFTGYEAYKIVTANNMYRYKFTVNY